MKRAYELRNWQEWKVRSEPMLAMLGGARLLMILLTKEQA